jgi:hypothetical protein
MACCKIPWADPSVGDLAERTCHPWSDFEEDEYDDPLPEFGDFMEDEGAAVDFIHGCQSKTSIQFSKDNIKQQLQKLKENGAEMETQVCVIHLVNNGQFQMIPVNPSRKEPPAGGHIGQVQQGDYVANNVLCSRLVLEPKIRTGQIRTGLFLEPKIRTGLSDSDYEELQKYQSKQRLMKSLTRVSKKRSR